MIPGYVKKILDELEQTILALYQLGHEINNPSWKEEIDRLVRAVKEPFLFVIVGEVKAGKSSFINALLDTASPIVEVGPQPTTDKINQLLYDSDERQVEINAYFRKIYVNHPMLRDISIVDTPGTNTIIKHHQEITERFIPIADLIVFVWEAKNPYRQSAWEFFDLLHNTYHKRMLFVLQQADLMEEQDLEININGVKKQLQEKGIEEPVVYALSAKQELEGETEGFDRLRTYIEEHVTGGKNYLLKVRSILSSTKLVIGTIESGITDRKKQYEADVVFRQTINEKISSEEIEAKKQVSLLAENLKHTFTDVCDEFETEISSTLSFWSLLKRSISSIFSKQQSLDRWVDDLQDRLQKQLEKQLQLRIESGVQGISQRIINLSEWIDLQIRSGNTILTNDHEIFSHIAQQRQDVMKAIQSHFEQWVTSDEVAIRPLEQKLSSNLPSQVATGSGLAVVGIVLAAVTKMMVFDITGGILTGIGLLLAGISSGYNRNKVVRAFRRTTKKGSQQIESRTKDVLQDYIETLSSQFLSAFTKLDEHIEKEKAKIEHIESTIAMINAKCAEIEKKVQ